MKAPTSSRRRQGNDGVITGGAQSVYGIRDSLVTAVLGADYATPRVVRKVKTKKVWTRPNNDKYPDALILEVRRLREQHNVKPANMVAVIEAYGYTVTVQQVNQWLQYSTRGHLIPATNAPPYLTTKEPTDAPPA